MSRPFLICALPRSRTAWLANFLTFGDIECGHELCAELSVAGLENYLTRSNTPFSGNADTGASVSMAEIRIRMPVTPIVVVKREPRDVQQSIKRMGINLPGHCLDFLVSCLEEVQQLPGTVAVRYENLDSERTMAYLQSFLAPGEPFNALRFQFLKGLNVQVTSERLAEILKKVDKQCSV